MTNKVTRNVKASFGDENPARTRQPLDRDTIGILRTLSPQAFGSYILAATERQDGKSLDAVLKSIQEAPNGPNKKPLLLEKSEFSTYVDSSVKSKQKLMKVKTSILGLLSRPLLSYSWDEKDLAKYTRSFFELIQSQKLTNVKVEAVMGFAVAAGNKAPLDLFKALVSEGARPMEMVWQKWTATCDKGDRPDLYDYHCPMMWSALLKDDIVCTAVQKNIENLDPNKSSIRYLTHPIYKAEIMSAVLTNGLPSHEGLRPLLKDALVVEAVTACRWNTSQSCLAGAFPLEEDPAKRMNAIEFLKDFMRKKEPLGPLTSVVVDDLNTAMLHHPKWEAKMNGAKPVLDEMVAYAKEQNTATLKTKNAIAP